VFKLKNIQIREKTENRKTEEKRKNEIYSRGQVNSQEHYGQEKKKD
jgi:hypothetical protein